jgi:hypothetical protein
MQQGKKPRPQTIRPKRTLLPFPEPLEARRLLSGSACGVAQPNLTPSHTAVVTAPAGIAGYTPDQIRQAYGIDQVPADGQGQTIAIVDAYNDPNIQSDLNTFDAQFGISAPPSFTVVSQSGDSVSKISTEAAWSAETALDVEWAHAIAPAANILLVEANSSSLTNLLAAVDYARNVDGVSVVSMSWGGGEFTSETQYDSLFTTPAGHTGVTFVAASGDRGAFFGAEWPASSPNVLSVGGTTMQPAGDSTSSTHHETAWRMSTSGRSAMEREPAYQRTIQQTGSRIIPDVALNADPDTGYAVFDSVANNGKSGWQVVGGTSAAAPQWGALVAVADQLRVASVLGTLDGATQTLPAVYLSADDPGTYSANFNAISTAFYGQLGQTLPDEGSTSGLGTPKAEVLIETLAQLRSGGTVTAAIAHGTQSAPGTETLATLTGGSLAFGGTGQSPQTFLSTAPPLQFQSSSSTTVPGIAGPQGPSATVFNDAPIHHPGSTLSVSGPGRIELSDLAASQRSSALALAGSAGVSGELGTGLAAWLANDTLSASDSNDLSIGRFRNSAARAIAAVFPIATVAISSTDVVTAIGAPVVQRSANILYRFANFDPVATFSDSLADFARESASVGPLETTPSSHRALIVTAAVIAVDTLLAAHWYNERRKTKKQEEERMKLEG